MICMNKLSPPGDSDVDIVMLQANTEYISCSATDKHVTFLWRVLEEFSAEERSAFLRFTW